MHDCVVGKACSTLQQTAPLMLVLESANLPAELRFCCRLLQRICNARPRSGVLEASLEASNYYLRPSSAGSSWTHAGGASGVLEASRATSRRCCLASNAPHVEHRFSGAFSPRGTARE